MEGKPAKTQKEKRVQNLLRASEFKRKQTAPILKLNKNSFGRGRKIPLAHKFLF